MASLGDTHFASEWCVTHNDWEVNTLCDGPMGYCRSVQTLNEQPDCVMVDDPPEHMLRMDANAVILEEIAERSS